MGRCCGPNDLENMHPAQQSSAATMRAVTAAVLADAASVLADAASALADTASALADTTQKFIQAQICVCCKYRSVFICWHVTFTNTDLYLQIQPLYLQIQPLYLQMRLCTCRYGSVRADAASALADAASALADAPLHLQIQHKSSCKHRSASAANTDLYLFPIMWHLQTQRYTCRQQRVYSQTSWFIWPISQCTICSTQNHHKHTTSRSLTDHERSWPGLSDLLTDLHKRCTHKLCKCTCTQNCALAHKIVHLHSFCAHLNFRTQNLAEVQIPARLLFEFINLGTPKPNQSQ